MTKLSWVLYIIDLIDNFRNISETIIWIALIGCLIFLVGRIAIIEAEETIRQSIIPILKKTIKIMLIVLFFAVAISTLLPNKKTMQMILAVELTNYGINETETGQQVKDIVTEGLDLLKNQLKDMNKEVK